MVYLKIIAQFLAFEKIICYKSLFGKTVLLKLFDNLYNGEIKMVSNKVEELLCQMFFGYESEEDIRKNPDKYLMVLLEDISDSQVQSAITKIMQQETKSVFQKMARREKTNQSARSFKWMKDGFDNTKGDNP